MKIKKIFILFTMLFAGFSFNGANSMDKNVVADAAASDSFAYLSTDWKTILTNKGVSNYMIKNLLITNDRSKVPTSGYISGCPIEVGLTDTGYTPTKYTNGCAVAAYAYPNADKFDCVLYADVETICPKNGSSLFSDLTNVEKITFDCNISMKEATSMYNMFYNDSKLVQIEGLTNIKDTVNVEYMSEVFVNCFSLKTLDVSSFDTSNVTTIFNTFYNCKSLTAITGLTKWNTVNVTNMKDVFANCSSLTTIDVSGLFNTSNVKEMNNMFLSCTSLTTIVGLESDNWNTSKVTNMSQMFKNCSSLTTLNVSKLKTVKVTNYYAMFESCTNLVTIEGLENWNTVKPGNINDMFKDCTSLKALDLSGFDFSEVTNGFNDMNITSSTSLEEIKAPKNMNGFSITLPSGFYVTKIDPSMEGMTIRRGSKEYNTFLNTVISLKTCIDYMQGPELQKTYIGLSDAEKEDFNTATDADGVLLTEKIAYMCYLAETKPIPAAAETYMAISPVTSQYLVIVIACLSLSLIGGYYFLQKKKYAK